MKNEKRSYFIANYGVCCRIIIAAVVIAFLFHVSITTQIGSIMHILIFIGYLTMLLSIQISCREVYTQEEMLEWVE